MNWYDDYDKELHPKLEKFKTAEDLAKSYVEVQSHMSNSLRIPSKDAGEDDIKKFHESVIEKVPNMMMKPDFENKEQSEAFYKMAGRPEEFGKYEAKAPDGYTPNEDRMKFLKEAAFAEGLSGKQFTSLMEKVHAEDFKAQQLQSEANTKEVDALKLEWGSAYDKKTETALDMSNKFFGDIFTKETIPSGFLKGLDKLSAQFSKEDLNEIKPKTDTVMTPLEANEKINEIYNNPEHPFFKETDVTHQIAIDRMVELQGYANPEKTG